MKMNNKIIISLTLVTILIVIISGCTTNETKKISPTSKDEECKLVLFIPDENCSADPYNSSDLGVKEINWLNDTVLLVSANVGINCAFEIGNASIKLENGTLKLEYEVIRYGDLMAKCSCSQKITYIISELDKDDYEIELVPIDIRIETPLNI